MIYHLRGYKSLWECEILHWYLSHLPPPMSHHHMTVWMTLLGTLNNSRGVSNKTPLPHHPNIEVMFQLQHRKKHRWILFYCHDEDIYRKFAFAHNVKNKLPTVSFSVCTWWESDLGVCEMSHWSIREHEIICGRVYWIVREERNKISFSVCVCVRFGFQEILMVAVQWYGKTCLAGTGTLNPSPKRTWANILLLNSFACFLVRVVLDLHS